jgi:hypothetical protein
MKSRRPARRTRQGLAVCLVLLTACLGVLVTTALAVALVAVPPSDAQVMTASPDGPSVASADEPGAPGTGTELPQTATSSDGFIVLGLAGGGIALVALGTAVHQGRGRRKARRSAW